MNPVKGLTIVLTCIVTGFVLWGIAAILVAVT